MAKQDRRVQRPIEPSINKPKAGAKAKPGASERDWHEETLARMRALILEADRHDRRAEMEEAVECDGLPVWSHNGIVCTGEMYTKVVKLTFAQGARIPDISRLLNSSLEGTREGRSTSTKGRRSTRARSGRS